MIENETMRSILARRSYKLFDGRPISDEALETIVTAGLYAPTGMNRQPWHFTVIRSREMRISWRRPEKPCPCPLAFPPLP
jgi:nitroreductase